MACYWGCGSTANKVVYAVMALFLIAGIAIAVAGGVSGRDCFEFYGDCMDVFDDRGKCTDLAKVCDLGKYILLIIIGIAFFITGLIITSWFCCCSKDPKTQAGAVAVAPDGTVVAQPYYPTQPVMAQPYNPGQPGMPQPYPTQPVMMAQPYNPGQPAMAQPYNPGQPVMAQPYDPSKPQG